jgi:hypothetical protein
MSPTVQLIAFQVEKEVRYRKFQIEGARVRLRRNRRVVEMSSSPQQLALVEFSENRFPRQLVRSAGRLV